MRAFVIFSMVLLCGLAAFPLHAGEPSPPDPAHSQNNAAPERAVMTSQRMVEILMAAADESQAAPNRVLLKYKGIELQCIYDERHDRMRILAPVAARVNISSAQFEKAMMANSTPRWTRATRSTTAFSMPPSSTP